MTPEPAAVEEGARIRVVLSDVRELWQANVNLPDSAFNAIVAAWQKDVATYAAAQRTAYEYEREHAERLKAQLAAAEEHAKFQVDRIDQTANERDALAQRLDAARAECEKARMQNVLGYDICDDCGDRWPSHDPECLTGRLLARLTPPGGGAA